MEMVAIFVIVGLAVGIQRNAGLMGNAPSTSAYGVVEASGDADMLNGFIFACILACVGGLMIVNGVARGLGVILLLAGILASVGITEMMR